MNIIFICKHNVFRSRVAEFYFKKLNKNPRIRASSGGLIKGVNNSSNQIKAMKELKVKMISKPKNLSAEELEKKDLIILVADDIPLEVFNNKDYVKRIIRWDIPDVLDNDKKKAEKTILLIKSRVEELIKKLNKK